MSVLEEDPQLGATLDPRQLALARERCRAGLLRLTEGAWPEPQWPTEVREGPGLLVLDGLLLRRVGLNGRFGAELLADGDLLRPWQREDAIASIPRRSGWRILQSCRLAVLDLGFARRTAAFPSIQAEIVARALRRSRHLAVNMAIVHQRKVDVRLHMLLWHLADQWGTIHHGGASIAVRLTHSQLAEMVAARRPTVSAALGSLERADKVCATEDGWFLRGPPPGELREVLDLAG